MSTKKTKYDSENEVQRAARVVNSLIKINAGLDIPVEELCLAINTAWETLKTAMKTEVVDGVCAVEIKDGVAEVMFPEQGSSDAAR